MIVIKDLRADTLGEPVFDKVNLVIRTGERSALLGPEAAVVTTFLRILANEEESDGGTVATEGEKIAYLSSEQAGKGKDSLAKLHHARPTFLLIDAGSVETGAMADLMQFIRGFRGGLLIASEDADLMALAKVTRVIEIQAGATVTSYTGSYADYLIEREKNRARLAEAYEKQQKEKRRLEDWLATKRIEAANDRSPEKGATIRAKAKYLKREILDKEIPAPESRD